MRILIFGASGATGRQLVRQGLDLGHEVTAFVRDPARLVTTHPLLRIVRGDVGDSAGVAEAVRGQDAVISALGVGKPLAHDPVVIDGVRHIVTAMQATPSTRRLIYQSFTGVSQSRAKAGWVVRNVARFPLRREIADHEAKERIVMATDLDWTIVRTPTLTNGPATGRVTSGEEVSATSILPRLSRADVAGFVLQQLSDTRYVRRSPSVFPAP